MKNDPTTLTNGALEASATEVVPRARCRRFSVQYKLRILREADECTGGTAVGALLRREGLYSSHLSQWRKQRSEGRLGTVKRGDNEVVALLEAQLEAAHRTIEGLRSKRGKAERIIDVQKKISSTFGIGIQDSESP